MQARVRQESKCKGNSSVMNVPNVFQQNSSTVDIDPWTTKYFKGYIFVHTKRVVTDE